MIKEFCRNKRESSIFRLSLFVLIVSLLFSTSIYLKKLKTAYGEDIKRLEIVKLKVNRTYEIKRYIESFSPVELKNPELSIAQLIDSVSLKFPEAKLELSERKKEEQEMIFPFSAKGEGSFQRYIDFINFFQQQSYPACFISSISLKAKEKTIDYEIKGKFRVILDDSQT